MREIKFRAWDKEQNKFLIHSNNHDTLIALTGDIFETDYYGTWEHYRPEKIELMQYTGLKDKNGIEIYEGDIINISRIFKELEDGDDVNQVEVEREYLGICSISPTMGSVIKVYKRTKDGEDDHSIKYLKKIISKYCEVIGNIYENKELLK